MTLEDMTPQAAEVIYDLVDPDANIHCWRRGG